MKKRRVGACIGLLGGALLLSPMTFPQSPNVPELRLREVDSTSVMGTSAAPTFLPLRCDSEGDVYLRFYQPLSPLAAPIVEISADGQRTKTFSLASAPSFRDFDINDFNLAPAGEGAIVLALWGPDPKTKKGRGYIVTFKSDGTLDEDSVLKLPAWQTPGKIAVFANGSVLVTGSEEEKIYPHEPPVSVPFTRILDKFGQVAKRLTLPGDVKPPKPGERGFKQSLTQLPAGISLGDAQTGSDGYIYLMRHVAKPIVYVIAPTGSVVRTLHLTPPFPTASVGPMQYSDADGGRLAMAFSVPASAGFSGAGQIIAVYSARTGKRLVDYIAPPNIGGALACYTTQGFTFLGSTPDHRLVLKHASAY